MASTPDEKQDPENRDREQKDRDRLVAARLDLLRAQQGGGLLSISQNASAAEAVRARQEGDDWRPPPPAPMGRIGVTVAIALVAIIVMLAVLMS